PEGSVEEILSELSGDLLEVRYDPADPTRIYIGDPGDAPSNMMAFVTGFIILGVAVLIGIVRVVSMVTNKSKGIAEHE
ncbi:MAG: Mu transposase C-terminal domain-containing protein, partial [Candidatus Poseidoniales archaeon]